MGRTRIWGLAAVAMAVLTGVGGDPALGATELYKGGTTLAAGTTIHSSLATGTSSLLEVSEASGIVSTCTGTTVESKTTSTAGEQVQAEVTSLAWSGCTSTTDTLTNGKLQISRIPGTDNGTLTSSETLWTVALGGTTCRYGTGEGTDLGTITGETSTAKHATVDIDATINEQAPKQTLCPDVTHWTATWTITTPTGLNVGEESAPPQVTELYKGKTTLTTGTTLHTSLAPSTSFGLVTTDATNVVSTCTGAELQAKTTATLGKEVPVGITSLVWSGCTSTTDTLTNGEWRLSHNPETDDGTLTSSATVWTVSLGGTSCRYGTGASTHLGTITGKTGASEHATVDINAVINEQEPKSFLCPDTTKATASWTVTTPTGLNVGGETDPPRTEIYKGEETLGKGTSLKLSQQSSEILSTTDSKTLIDTCATGTVEASTSAADGAPLTVAITSLARSGCTVTTDTLTNGSLSITGIAESHNGTLSGSGTVWTVNFSGVSCRYGFGEGTDLGTITGKTGSSEHATVDINAVINEQAPKQFLCPDTTRWTPNYTVTTPTGLNVRVS